MISPEFLLTSLIVALSPGVGVIYTVSVALFRGWRESVVAALGCTLGVIPHLLASTLGLSLILHISAVTFQSVKLLGAGYLLYLAWRTWRDAGKLAFDASAPAGPWLIAGKAVLLNLLNPKLTLFFVAFLPLFISREAPGARQLFRLSLVFMLITLGVFVLYGLLASRVRRYVVHSPSAILWLQRSFALAFAGLGLRLALAEP